MRRCGGCGAMFRDEDRGARCACTASQLVQFEPAGDVANHAKPRVDRVRLARRRSQCRQCEWFRDGDCARFSCQHGYEQHLLWGDWPFGLCPLDIRQIQTHGPFRLPPEVLQPSATRAMVCVVIGDRVREHHALTRSSQEAYARRLGLDYLVLQDDRVPEWPLANKWRAGTIASQYDATLLIDADVWISPEAPDIFAATPGNEIAVHNEWPDQRPEIGTDWIVRESLDVARTQQLEVRPIDWEPNCGVMVIPRSRAPAYCPPPLAYPTHWTAEQHWLALRLRELGWGYYDLDARWNWCWIRSDFRDRLSEAWFVHVNGAPQSERLALLASLDRS